MEPLESRSDVGGNAADHNEPLHLSVITSCSVRCLRDLLLEIPAVDDVSRFDLFVLRDVDVTDIEKSGSQLVPAHGSPPHLDKRYSARILAEDQSLDVVHCWLVGELGNCNDWLRQQGRKEIRVPALATYFRGITACSSLDDANDPPVDWRRVPYRVA